MSQDASKLSGAARHAIIGQLPGIFSLGGSGHLLLRMNGACP